MANNINSEFIHKNGSASDLHALTVPRSRIGWWGWLCLLLSIACLVVVVANYDIAFQNPEVFTNIFNGAVVNGPKFSFQDFVTAFDIREQDGGRPRFVSYFFNIITLKTRLALWGHVLPHPSFSPIWILTLVIGPLLLFKFLDSTLGNRAAALMGVAVYMVSPGLLGGAAMLFNLGKPLANVLLISVFYLSGVIDRRMRGNGGSNEPVSLRAPFAALVCVLTIAPFVDETAMFAYLVPVVWCPYLFVSFPLSGMDVTKHLRNWAVILTPAVITVVLIVVIIPALSTLTPGERFDLQRYAASVAHFDKLNPAYVIWQTYNMFAAELLPGAYGLGSMPVLLIASGTSVALPLGGFAVCVAACLIMTLIVRAGKAWAAYRKIALLIAAFAIFQSLVLLFHPALADSNGRYQLIVASGHYYGALFSVLVSILLAIVLDDLLDRRNVIADCFAAALVIYVGATSVSNFYMIHKSWKYHTNVVTLNLMAGLPFYGRMGNWEPLDSLKARDPGWAYVADVPDPTSTTASGQAREIWRRWRQGDRDLLKGADVHIRDLWIVRELTFLR